MALKNWTMVVKQRTSHKKAVVALARKLAVIMHAIWTRGAVFEERQATDRSREIYLRTLPVTAHIIWGHPSLERRDETPSWMTSERTLQATDRNDKLSERGGSIKEHSEEMSFTDV